MVTRRTASSVASETPASSVSRVPRCSVEPARERAEPAAAAAPRRRGPARRASRCSPPPAGRPSRSARPRSGASGAPPRARGARARCACGSGAGRAASANALTIASGLPSVLERKSSRRVRDDMEIDLLVGAGEHARAQRRDEADRVGGIVDRGQQVREVEDLLAREEPAAALDSIRDRLAAQRSLELVDAGARGEEDRDVPEASRGARPGSSRRAPSSPRRWPGGWRRRSAAPRSRAPPRLSRRARRGARRSSGTRRRARRRVGTSAVFGGCTPKLSTSTRSKTSLTQSMTPAVERKFCTSCGRSPRAARCAPRRRPRCRRLGSGRSTASGRPTTVSPPGRGVRSSSVGGRLVVGCDQERDLGLDGVGVLELVDEQHREAPAEVRARLALVAAARAPR